jgi:glutaredoxin-related protein
MRNEWSYTFTPAYAFVACQRTAVRVRGINNVRRLEKFAAEPLVPKVWIGIETEVQGNCQVLMKLIQSSGTTLSSEI